MTGENTRENLQQARDLTCSDTGVESCQGWIQHTRGFIPRRLEKETFAWDVMPRQSESLVCITVLPAEVSLHNMFRDEDFEDR